MKCSSFKSRRLPILMAVAGLVLTGSAVDAARSRTLVHPFNSKFWSTTTEGSGPAVQDSKGVLVFTLPAKSSGETFKTHAEWRPLVRGDFDVRVDYRLLEWPAENGVKISLGTGEGSVQRASDPGQGGEVYLVHFDAGGVAGTTPTTDAAGKLRLTRKGNILTGFIYRNGGWMTLHSTVLPAVTPVRVHLSAWSHDRTFADKPVRVAFDNFMLRKEGDASYRSRR
ncbi:MAG: hypothetical protein KY468_11055 [Armatimonadetes bacterium]|nr:hypothetical protein [Armatimonadota bacterium]